MVESNREKYRLSFTSGALWANESSIVLDTYSQNMDWAQTEALVKAENRLQARMNSTAVRTLREIIGRLKVLSNSQIQFFQGASFRDRKYLLWLAVCKHYKFIADFAVEVMREKFLKMDYMLAELDFDAFFENKAEWHPELDQLKESTRKKLKQNLYRMMRESEITNERNTILSAIISPELRDLIKADPQGTLAVFPVPESLL